MREAELRKELEDQATEMDILKGGRSPAKVNYSREHNTSLKGSEQKVVLCECHLHERTCNIHIAIPSNWKSGMGL